MIGGYPALEIRSTGIARYYTFRPTAEQQKGSHAFGWAICTVNDSTGELQIMSDWGDWAYRWNTAHLGSPTLTDFIAGRETDHCHYLADKLTSGQDKKREEFSPEKTVARLREIVIERRRSERLGKEYARQIWDDLGELERENDEREFSDRYYENVSGCHGPDPLISDGIWEYLRYEKTTSYLILLHSILPALVHACDVEVATRNAEPLRVWWPSHGAHRRWGSHRMWGRS